MCNGVVILCNINKTDAIFKTYVSSNFPLHEMLSCKKESIIPKRYAWKTLCSSKKLPGHMGETIIYWENYHVTKHDILYQVF